GANVVHLHQSNSSGIIYATHDRRVVTGWQVCNDCRLPSVSRSVAAVLNLLNLIVGDNAANDRSLPVIIGANQSSGAVMQFQCRISQRIWNTILAELRANGANDHALCAGALDDEPPDDHVVARLDKRAC